MLLFYLLLLFCLIVLVYLIIHTHKVSGPRVALLRQITEHLMKGDYETELTLRKGDYLQDVADELGMTPGAVRVAKCRVLQRLREELGDVIE